MKIGYNYYKKLLDIYISILKKELGDSLISVVLYGSVARNSATLHSDIDLLVVLKEGKENYYQTLQPLLKAQKNLEKDQIYKKFSHNDMHPHFSYLILSSDEASKNRKIYLDMIEDGIILYDRGEFIRKKFKELKSRLKELGSKKILLKDGRWYWDLKPDLKIGEVFEL
ncbi:MAG: nucleotidyltransferase domain-containing protein [candidate division WOR-3 bacterium]|nr:nucleotidyltransferase domain-containing protein [candidate division WOR-3 bacterium]